MPDGLKAGTSGRGYAVILVTLATSSFQADKLSRIRHQAASDMTLTGGIIMGLLIAAIVVIASSSVSLVFLLIPALLLGLAVGKRPRITP